MIDLHSHSTFSDGSFTPRQLAMRARDVGLTALALTDHDTTAGLPQFMDACGEYGITGVPGVEISVDVPSGTMHMLGYFIPAFPVVGTGENGLEDVLKRIRCGREERNTEILRKLNAIGFKMTFDDVKAFTKEDVIGRPHFALAMVQKGYVASKEAAFDLYLGKGKPAYAERYRMSASDGIAAIVNSGGVPVLAHPFTLNLGRKALREFVKDIAQKGLKGIEVYYSEHNSDHVREYEALTREFDLVATGGSDFHGQLNPQVELGKGFGNLKIEDSILEILRKRRNGNM
jgi:3',5'-nucleoside bisphosphate phosphatase